MARFQRSLARYDDPQRTGEGEHRILCREHAERYKNLAYLGTISEDEGDDVSCEYPGCDVRNWPWEPSSITILRMANAGALPEADSRGDVYVYYDANGATVCAECANKITDTDPPILRYAFSNGNDVCDECDAPIEETLHGNY